MGLIYSDCSVFGTDAQTIVNTVNCVGVMGAGVALEFRLRYPPMFEDYSTRCKNQEVKTGQPYLFKSKNIWILNFPTKDHWRYPSRLEWIIKGLKNFQNNYKRNGIESIAFPKLGTDKGGLIWKDVNQAIKEHLHKVNIPIYICLDKKPDDTESMMINYINDRTFEELIEMKIRKHIAKKIIHKLPIKRFREILLIPGVGKGSYELLHHQIYTKITDKNPNGIKKSSHQTSLEKY